MIVKIKKYKIFVKSFKVLSKPQNVVLFKQDISYITNRNYTIIIVYKTNYIEIFLNFYNLSTFQLV